MSAFCALRDDCKASSGQLHRAVQHGQLLLDSLQSIGSHEAVRRRHSAGSTFSIPPSHAPLALAGGMGDPVEGIFCRKTFAHVLQSLRADNDNGHIHLS